MWIWISVGVWAYFLCVLLAWYMMNQVSRKMASKLWGLTLFGPATVIAMLIVEGRDCFPRKETEMEKVYWDKKTRLMTSQEGWCLLNPTGLTKKIQDIEQRVNKQVLYLECAAKGHKKWRYVSKTDSQTILEEAIYCFRCSVCGLEITKTDKELTIKEKEGLTKLGLL